MIFKHMLKDDCLHFRERTHHGYWKSKMVQQSKGYGFIQTSEGEDIFVHFSAIQAEGFKTLGQGQEVEFEISAGPKGPQAQNLVTK